MLCTGEDETMRALIGRSNSSLTRSARSNLKCTGTLGLPEAVVALLPVAQDVDSEAFGHFLIGLGTALVTNGETYCCESILTGVTN